MLLSELLKVEENLNDFKYLYDAQFLDNDAVYDKDNVELINVDNILSPYFNESIKINKNTFNNLNEYVIYGLDDVYHPFGAAYIDFHPILKVESAAVPLSTHVLPI